MLLVLALVRRSATALIALLLPAVVWLNLFGGLLTDKSGSGGDLTVATHNVNADNPDPAGTAKEVAASGADVRRPGGAAGSAVPAYEKALAGDVQVPLGAGHGRAVEQVPDERHPAGGHQAGLDARDARHRARRPTGAVAVYVAHLPSVRVKLNAGLHRQPARQQRRRAGRGHRRRAARAR